MKSALMCEITKPVESSRMKLTVVGSGQVGMAVAFALVSQKICSELALVDVIADKLKGEAMDLEHAQAFTGCKIKCSTDYEVTKNSRICIITAGTAQKPGESRLDMVVRNSNILKSIVPKLMEFNKDTILLIVSNPVDVLTYVAWKTSGLPTNRVFGSGTTLDSARFRLFISQRLDVAPSSVHGWIVGEHGDSSVPVWSSISVGGVRLMDINKDLGTDKDLENWDDIHKEVVQSAYDIIKLKGYTSWAIGLTVAQLVRAVLFNSRDIFPVSTHVKGCKHDLDKEVFMSLPCVLGENGIAGIVKETMTEEERSKLHKSASILYDVQRLLNI
ncbi:L-lactate dehydrogenase-like [Periplaneta americana]|uniref:L-lactate dehydrogenase-like n=1 Tax=Periplaneta americana TaxID=6978 RepID=UPI0037E734C0